MFFIVNKTKKNITLGDLGITLGPKQAVDLDKMIKRHKSEASKSLKVAKKNGDIEIRVKDQSPPEVIPAPPPPPPSDKFGNMKQEIIGEMKDVMKELLGGQTGGVSKEDLQALIDAMPRPQETVIYRQEGEKIEQRENEEVEIDGDILAKINARTVDDIVKDTDINAVHYEEKQEENTILDNVDELEDLLDL